MSTDALELALALHQAPIKRFALRDRSLPENIAEALQLASAMQPQLELAAARFQESEETIVEAVRFYLHQVLFEPGTDAYRVLGLASDADIKLIRQHHIWLQRWLHPDRRGEDWEAVFSTKVNWAWQQLRNDSSRNEYDQLRLDSVPQNSVNDDADEPIMQTPAWNVEQIAGKKANWPRRIAIGGLLAVCAGLFYLAATREDKVDLDSLAQRPLEPGAPVQASAPFAGLAENHGRSSEVVRTDVSAEPAVAGIEVLQPANDDPALQGGSGSTEHGIGAPLASEHANSAVSAVTKIRGSQSAARDDGDPASTATTPAQIPAKPIGVNELHPVVAKRAPRAPAGSAVAERDASTSASAWKQSKGNTQDVTLAQEAAQNRQVATADEGESKSLSLATPGNEPDEPQTSEDASGTSAHARESTVAISDDTLSRFELARKHVRNMVSYFRSQNVDLTEWNDAQGQRTVAREREALHARIGPAGMDRFVLDPPQWRVSDTAVSLEATYHAAKGRAATESGQLLLDMAWHDGGWKIMRIEVLPSP